MFTAHRDSQGLKQVQVSVIGKAGQQREKGTGIITGLGEHLLSRRQGLELWPRRAGFKLGWEEPAQRYAGDDTSLVVVEATALVDKPCVDPLDRQTRDRHERGLVGRCWTRMVAVLLQPLSQHLRVVCEG
jgi:hypothetical protein